MLKSGEIMLKREQIENLVKRKSELKNLKEEINNLFETYKAELFERAYEVLQWKDNNLGEQNLKNAVKELSYIESLRSNFIILCIADTNPDIKIRYCLVTFDEIFSDDWKTKALKHLKYLKENQ